MLIYIYIYIYNSNYLNLKYLISKDKQHILKWIRNKLKILINLYKTFYKKSISLILYIEYYIISKY
jgi:hypothetical protein